ncbi:MAG TPA: peptidylprolyl isomerase, partial [Bacteroidales bacterium]|nr:peptidylprolyl isomerase [Bacteroidales bacterium]
GHSSKIFGKVNGEVIRYQDFDKLVNEQIESYMQKNGLEKVTTQDIFEIRQSVWENIVKDKIMLKQYEALGLAIKHDNSQQPSISPEELSDLILGNNPHPYIFQNFINPKTGKFDRERVQNILENFDKMDPKDQKLWVSLEQAIKNEKLNSKYKTLISQGYYTPTAFAKREYEERNTTAKIRFVALTYKSLSDSTIVINENDYKTYYNEHKKEFEQEKSRDLIYVTFDILPSPADRAAIDSTVRQIYSEFKNVKETEIPNFVRKYSDEGNYDSSYYKKGSFLPQIDSILFNSPISTVFEPYVDNNVYYIHHLIDKQMRPDSIKVGHIFITYKDAKRANQNVTRSKQEAEKLADSLLVVIKKDTSTFSNIAKDFSDDLSAKENGGNLGWLPDGHLIKELNDACIANKIGDILLIKSEFGYHILKIYDKTKPVEKVKVATITKPIMPSEKTIDKIYAQAAEFATEATDATEFEKAVIAKKLNKKNAQFVQEMSYSLPGVESAREVIQWAFADDTKKGDASGQVFNCETKYVVAAVTEVREKGIATLEQVKTYIEPLVKREKKAQLLTEKMNIALSQNIKDINVLAAKLKVKVDTIDAISFYNYNLPGYGPEPKFIGTVFGLNKNMLSKPIKGEQAIYVVFIDDVKKPSPEKDFSPWKAQVTGFFRARITNPQNDDIYNALRRKANIIDNRKYFY